LRKDLKQTDLKRVGLLGCGGFGAVTLEQHKVTGETFALKQLSKGYVIQTKMEKSVMSEKNILAMCNSKLDFK
jgi:serine/threonine protein kinase